MAAELAQKSGRQFDDVEDWRPLLRFAQGNPLTLTVLVGHALRTNLTDRERIANFVGDLQSGQSVFEDEASEGRTRSLAASLAYGFESAFAEPERKQLALLHFFQGFVSVDALVWMGRPESPWSLPELAGLSLDAGIALLDRAAEVGLLRALGEGEYSIHPALPWFFRRLFDQNFLASGAAPVRAFVETMSDIGGYLQRSHNQGNDSSIAALAQWEASLLYAHGLAGANRWPNCVVGTIQGLQLLYSRTARKSDLARLVVKIASEFEDPGPDPPAGAADYWSIVTGYRVDLARDRHDWNEALRLQQLRVDRIRRRAADALSQPEGTWTPAGKHAIYTLADQVHIVAQIQRQQRSPLCLAGYKEALELGEKIGDRHRVSMYAYNVANALMEIDEIRDLPAAEQWAARSLETISGDDRTGRAQCLDQLASIALRRFDADIHAGREYQESLPHLARAERYCQQALATMRPGAIVDAALFRSRLGVICAKTFRLEEALTYYGESIQDYESMGDRLHAGRTRRDAAIGCRRFGRLLDAHEWAQAALRDFEACDDAQQDMMDTLSLLAEIESDRQATSPPS